MNPALLLLILAGLSGQGNGRGPASGPSLGSLHLPGYFDTFKMELLLDRLHGTVDALERINRLSQIAKEPLNQRNSGEKIRESVDAVKPFLPEGRSHQLDNITGAMDTLKQFGDMQGLMQAMGPMLKMLTASQSSNDDSYAED